MRESIQSSKIEFDPSDLPTMPAVASELLRTSDLEEIDIRKLAESIRKDASLSARILQIVNSSFFGFSNRIGTVSQALVALGIRATRSLVLSYSVLGLTPRGSTDSFDYDSFWARSLNAATTAREIARAIGSKVSEEAFLAGLLQDIGMVVLAQKMPKHYAKIMKRAKDERIPLLQVEREELGTDHAAVGAHVLEAWSFPDELVLPIFNHHDAVFVNLTPELRKMCSIQFIASGLGDWLYNTERREDQFAKILDKIGYEIGLSMDDFAAVLEEIDTAVEANAALFDVTVQRAESYTALLKKPTEW